LEHTEIRKQIQSNGNDVYQRMGGVSKNLQYIAGELMTENVELVVMSLACNECLTVGAEHVIKHGFTANQISFLEGLEKELQWYKKSLSDIEDRLSLLDEGLL